MHHSYVLIAICISYNWLKPWTGFYYLEQECSIYTLQEWSLYINLNDSTKTKTYIWCELKCDWVRAHERSYKEENMSIYVDIYSYRIYF